MAQAPWNNSRGFRNNNPGNIRGKYFGANGIDGGYATYATPQEGIAAIRSQLARYASGATTGKPLNTVSDIISTWAPPSDGNPTDAYVQSVSKRLGVDPNQPIDVNNPEVMRGLIEGIITQENGGMPYQPTLLDQAMTQQPPVGAAQIIQMPAGQPMPNGAQRVPVQPMGAPLPPVQEGGFVGTIPEPQMAQDPAPSGGGLQPGTEVQFTDQPNRRDASPLAMPKLSGFDRFALGFGPEGWFRMASGFLGGNGGADSLSKGFGGAAESLENQAKLRILAQKAQMTGRSAQQGSLFYAPDGTTFREVFNPRDGITYLNANTGQRVTTLPKGSLRAEDSIYKTQSKANAEATANALKIASEAPGQIRELDQLTGLIESGVTGPDLLSRAGRAFAQYTGLPIGDFDPTNIQLTQQKLQKHVMEKAQALLDGQGAVSNFEREIVRDAGPNILMNKDALRVILQAEKRNKLIDMELADAWVAAPPAEKQEGFQTFAYRFRRNKYKEYEAAQQNSGGPTSSPNPANQGQGTFQNRTKSGIGFSFN